MYFATQAQALPNVARFLRDRAFWPPAVREVVRYGDSGTLPVPGGGANYVLTDHGPAWDRGAVAAARAAPVA